MALFQVTRYFGDEEETEKKKQEASEILKRLQEEAEVRRKSLGKDNKQTEDARKSSKLEHHETLGKEAVKSDEKEHSDKSQKKILHADSTIDVTEIKHEHTVVDEDIAGVSKKKKKKRKHKLSHSELANETNIEDDLKKIKIDETDNNENFVCEGTESQQPSKKHKKKKKHRNKEETVELPEHSENKETKVADVEDIKMESDDEGFDSMKNEESDKERVTEAETEDRNKNEIGGFTVLGSVRPTKLEKVHRVLPDWLSKPSIISADLDADKLPVAEMPGLAPDLMDKLKENKISHFFPVQHQVIPALLESSLTGFQTGRAGYRPSDICVSAPTGSGKTLAFVLPIVQALRTRVTCEVRALAVLPVRDLATQVFKVFQTYSKGTSLKVGLMIGQKTFLAEQQSLVKKRLQGYQSMFDILVATPGRLVDHINKTEGFNLGHLRYLVIDEADRMMDEIKQDWLIQVENCVYRSRPRPGPLTAASSQHMDMPLQKLLYSATLSQNPEKLQQLNLFQPKLFTSVVKSHRKVLPVPVRTTGAGAEEEIEPEVKTEPVADEEPEPGAAGGPDSDVASDLEETDRQTASTENKTDSRSESQTRLSSKPSEEKSGDFVGKYATPSSLSEYFIETTAAEKPLIILHLLHHLHYGNILCFTNSVEATHRLCLLLKLYGGIEAKEFSSNLHAARRDAIIHKFMAGKIDILVCSDAMARGMDISNVKFVISYDPPPYIQTYIHRIGRTARAGKEGSAFTLLQKKEFFHFKKMVREAGKAVPSPLKIYKEDLKPLLPKYEETLKQLGDVLKNEKPKRRYTPKKLEKKEIKNNTG